jgi:hypothetical protein
MDFLRPFPSRYELSLDSELPSGSGGYRRYYYPGAATEGGMADLMVLVKPDSVDPWYGFFVGIRSRGGRYAEGIFTCPDPDALCVVVRGVGYLVNVTDPRSWTTVPVHPALAILPVIEKDLLLFNDFTRVVAVGAGGVAWIAQPGTITDNLVVDRVAGDRLHVRGDNYAIGAVEAILNVSTGQPA